MKRFIILIGMMMLLILGITIEPEAQKAISDEWRQDRWCGQKLTDSVRAEIPGCEDAFCVNISDCSKICACLLSSDTGDSRITYTRRGEVVLHWNTIIYPPAIASALRVDSADLNGDGKEELVIATMSSAAGKNCFSLRPSQLGVSSSVC
ncbi:MAG: hypothetical protein ACOZF0_08890 [Thermodesulfobacteriota bacterium]